MREAIAKNEWDLLVGSLLLSVCFTSFKLVQATRSKKIQEDRPTVYNCDTTYKSDWVRTQQICYTTHTWNVDHFLSFFNLLRIIICVIDN
jgi:hypothetical protein